MREQRSFCRSIFAVFATVVFGGGCRDRTFDQLYTLHADNLAAVSHNGSTSSYLKRATRGVALPAGAQDISLCQGNSRDTLAYLVFSAERDEITHFIEVSLGIPFKKFTSLDSESGRIHFNPNDITAHQDFTPWKGIANIKRGVFYSGGTYDVAVDLDRNTVYFIGG